MNMIKFASFISYITAMMNSGDRGTLANHEIECILDHVRELITPLQVNLVPMFSYMLTNQKINAIKEHRALTGMGLKESKDEIDRLMAVMKLPEHANVG